MRARIVALAACVGLVTIISAPAAQAGTVCNVTGLCGQVTNRSDSKYAVLITSTWPQTSPAAKWRRLVPGARSTSYWKDTDGFMVASGYKAYDRSWGTFGPGWHKITDAQHLSLYVYKS